MEKNDCFNTTERYARFNTTEWNGTIVLTQRNGMEQNGNGTATVIPLHGIQMGTFIDAYCIWIRKSFIKTFHFVSYFCELRRRVKELAKCQWKNALQQLHKQQK